MALIQQSIDPATGEIIDDSDEYGNKIPVSLDDGAQVPSYAHGDDAGADLTSVEDVMINPGERVLVRTGVHIELDADLLAWVTPRSGLAVKHGITIVNAPGLIDGGYRGEIMVCLLNTSGEAYQVKKGDKIAQLVIQEYIHAGFKVVPELQASDRESGGFGSTGR
jgi:dUTP pyrophosphatase